MSATLDLLHDLLRCHDRVGIVGGPATGKTALAAQADLGGRTLLGSDVFAHLPWSAQPQALVDALADFPRYLVEGVTVARCLVPRPARPVLDLQALLWLRQSHRPLRPGQRRLLDRLAAQIPGLRRQLPNLAIVSVGGER